MKESTHLDSHEQDGQTEGNSNFSHNSALGNEGSNPPVWLYSVDIEWLFQGEFTKLNHQLPRFPKLFFYGLVTRSSQMHHTIAAV